MATSRRQFLKQTVGFSAALLLSGKRAVTLAQGVDLRDKVEALVGGGEARHVMAIGDFGVKLPELARQQAVADAMAKYLKAKQLKPDALALLGDNFYGGFGGKGVQSDRWNINIEQMYKASDFPCPLFAMLGNHDYGDEAALASVKTQLAYKAAKPDTRWHLPAKWYRMNLPDENPLATVLVIDTNRILSAKIDDEKKEDPDPAKAAKDAARKAKEAPINPSEPRSQVEWLKAELAKPRTTPWLFVMGHHPLYSDGVHGDNAKLIALLDPLFRQHKVDLYLTGHDHDLQHIEFDGHPTSFVISGGGGARAREPKRKERSKFGQGIYGFSHLELRKDAFVLTHVDANGKELHSFSKTRDGKMAVVG
jgi:hypothetical protein